MLLKKRKSYNHLLIQLKKEKNITADKLAEIADVNIATLNSWLANPNTTKWRRLDKVQYYIIKSRLNFHSKTSYDAKDNILRFLHDIEIGLNIAFKSASLGTPISKYEKKFITQAKDMLQCVRYGILDLIPADKEEREYLNSIQQEELDEATKKEEDFYFEFLSSINKNEVLELHYIQNKSSFSIARLIKFPVRFVERLIREDKEKSSEIYVINSLD
ncbi:hypothetical protein [Legionella fairfieldensis]|uniref:hypothetical protein n=1 Tax=Legionella fairfieldensis TaxID=45064 RepID=UPI00049005D1|nr:hypothetical protein [Legionella fairfieldensis]